MWLLGKAIALESVGPLSVDFELIRTVTRTTEWLCYNPPCIQVRTLPKYPGSSLRRT